MSSRMRPFVVVQAPHISAPLDHSAAIELADTDRGFLPNRLTTAQRDAIADPAPGLLIYNTSDMVYQFFDGLGWNAIGSGSSSLSSENVTTGSSTVDADPSAGVTHITTGGTGGIENLVL